MKASELADIMADKAETIVTHLFPQGKRKGREFLIGSLNGEKGESLSICLEGHKKGIWSDFAMGSPGGDMLDLWCRANNTNDVSEGMKSAMSFLGIMDTSPTFTNTRKKPTPLKPEGKFVKDTKTHEWLNSRLISNDTIRDFQIKHDGKNCVFPYYRDGDIWMIKYRVPFTKEIWCSKDPFKILFGWQCLDQATREVIICEGETDTLSWHELGHPVLGVPLGAGKGGKHDWIDNEYERLKHFDTIYVSMDMDKSGAEAFPEIVERLGRHRCRVVELPLNDANECLMAGIDLQECLDNAKTLDPKELKNSEFFIENVRDRFNGKKEELEGVRLPWSFTWNNIRLRKGEISIWAGRNGSGKSNILTHVAIEGATQRTRWCIASMEVLPVKMLMFMYRQASGVDDPSEKYISKVGEWFKEWLWLFTQTGTTKAEKILEVFEYARRRYGIDHFIIDSLAKCGIDEDDYKRQKWFVDVLGDFSRDHECHVHLVAHSRKHENEAYMPGKLDVKGTGAITDMVDNVFTVWRNKPKEEALAQINPDSMTEDEQKVFKKYSVKPDCILTCSKQRHHDWEGPCALWYDIPSHQFLQAERDTLREYLDS